MQTICKCYASLTVAYSNSGTMWGKGARANSHFPDAKFQPPPQPTSSHHRDYGASLDALCLVPLPTHPWMERAKGILPPYTWSPHKDPIV